MKEKNTHFSVCVFFGIYSLRAHWNKKKRRNSSGRTEWRNKSRQTSDRSKRMIRSNISSAYTITREREQAKKTQPKTITHMEHSVVCILKPNVSCNAFDHWQITFSISRIAITNNVHNVTLCVLMVKYVVFVCISIGAQSAFNTVIVFYAKRPPLKPTHTIQRQAFANEKPK